MSRHRERARVVLVHGTGSAVDRDEGDRWFQHGSDFERALTQIVERYHCELAPTAVFHWTGANSEEDRRHAGERLRQECRVLELEGVPYHLVGHSHGGSVIWHCLRRAPGLQHLRSVTTVGTPFFRFDPDPFQLLWGLPLAFALSAVPTLVTRSAVLIAEARGLYREGEILSLAGILLGWLTVLTVAAVAGIRLPRVLIAYYRARHRRRDDKRAWGEYGSIWNAIACTEDEAINGLSRVAESSPPSIATRPPAQATRLGKRLFAPITSRLLRLVDLFIWQWIYGRALGNDAGGERLASLTALPPGASVPCPRVDSVLDAELVASANECAARSVSVIRSRLGTMVLGGAVPSSVFSVLGKLDWRILVHTSYFDQRTLQERIGRIVARSDDASALGEEPRAETRARAVVDVARPSPWLVIATTSLLMIVQATGLLGSEALFRAAVLPRTVEYKIGAAIRDAPLRHVAREGGMDAIHAWLAALHAMHDSQAFDEAVVVVVDEFRKRGDGDIAWVALRVVTDESAHIEWPPAFPDVRQFPDYTTYDSDDREFIISVASELDRAGLGSVAVDLLFGLDDYYWAETEYNETATGIALGMQPGLRYVSRYDDPDEAAALLAERGDLAGARNVIEFRSNRPHHPEFTESDDIRDSAGSLLRTVTTRVSAILGAAAAEAYARQCGLREYARVWSYASNGALEGDELLEVGLADQVEGRLLVGDVAGAHRLLGSFTGSSDPFLLFDSAVNVVRANRGDLVQARSAFATAVQAFQHVDRRNEEHEIRMLLALMETQIEDDWSTGTSIADRGMLRAGARGVDAPIWSATLRQLLREGRDDDVAALLREASTGAPRPPIHAEIVRAALEARRAGDWRTAWALLQSTAKTESSSLAILQALANTQSTRQPVSATRDPDRRLSAYRRVWQGDADALLDLEGAELAFALCRCVPVIEDVEALLSAADRIPSSTNRLHALEVMANAFEDNDRATDARDVWRRMADVAERSEGRLTRGTAEHGRAQRALGTAAVGLQRTGDGSSVDLLVDRVDAEAQLRIYALKLRHLRSSR